MNNLQISGKQHFMGKEIPVVLGGFGVDKRCISDKTIAEIHSMEIKHVRELLNRNAVRFREGEDSIDIKKVVVENDDNLFSLLGYSQMQISKSEHIYILSERGYAKLIKIMDTDLAWDIHDKLIDEYFELREGKKTLSAMEMMKLQFAAMEELDSRVETLEEKVDKQITLDHGQQRTLQNIVSNRAYERAGQVFPKAIRENVGRFFQAIYRDLKNRFGVASYRDINVNDYTDAIHYVEAWIEPAEVRKGVA